MKRSVLLVVATGGNRCPQRHPDFWSPINEGFSLFQIQNETGGTCSGCGRKKLPQRSVILVLGADMVALVARQRLSVGQRP